MDMEKIDWISVDDDFPSSDKIIMVLTNDNCFL